MVTERRYDLGRKVNERGVYTGVYNRHGTKQGSLLTIMLIDIKDANGKIVANHLWFNLTDRFKSLGKLKQGDQLRFTARVTTYYKNNGRILDYKLSYPTKIERV
jgi:phage tail tube protein FII